MEFGLTSGSRIKKLGSMYNDEFKFMSRKV